MQTYHPIQCSDYDLLESLATIGTRCSITYAEEGLTRNVQAIIKDLVTENKQEYMLLDNGETLRLDTIISINGRHFSNVC